jgi:hypothetical protein
MRMREGDVELGPGDLLVVAKGVEHCPRASEMCQLLLIEPFGTPNTGDGGASGLRRKSVLARGRRREPGLPCRWRAGSARLRS